MERYEVPGDSDLSRGMAMFKNTLLIGRNYLNTVCDNNTDKYELFNSWYYDIVSSLYYINSDSNCMPFPILDRSTDILYIVTGIKVGDNVYRNGIGKLSPQEILDSEVIITDISEDSKFINDFSLAFEELCDQIDILSGEDYPESVYDMLNVNVYCVSLLFYLSVLFHDRKGSFKISSNKSSDIILLKMMLGTSLSTLKHRVFANQRFKLDGDLYVPQIDYVITADYIDDESVMIVPLIKFIGIKQVKN